MYTVLDYGRMANDSVRMDAYARAIAKTVRPGAVVLDCGAGTGIMSFLALKAGAARVHAIDPNPAVWLVPELAKANGLGDRIIVHQDSPTDIEPPEPIDVAIADIRGPTPLIEHNFEVCHDVKKRWLAKTGVIVPQRDRLRVVLVEAEALERVLEDSCASFIEQGLAIEPLRRSLRNQTYTDTGRPLHASDVLSTASTWATLEYGEATPVAVEGTASLEVTRGGLARGVCVFFETDLCDGVSFDTAPGKSVAYNRLYLPLAVPVRVAPADRIEITLRADGRGSRWAWDTRLTRGASELGASRQSTFLGEPVSMESLLKGSDGFRPTLGEKGLRLRGILEQMNGEKTVGEIAEGTTGDGALDLVRAISAHYAR